MGLMATSSKRAHAVPGSTAPRAPAPAGTSIGDAQTPVSVSVGSLGPSAHKVCLSPHSISGGYGV